MNEIIDRNIILSLGEHEREMYILFCGFVDVHASMDYGFHLHSHTEIKNSNQLIEN